MHIGRFQFNNDVFYGAVENELVKQIEGDILSDFKITDKEYPLQDLKILLPTEPEKIILVGLNYRDHAEELGFDIPDEPVIFMKPPTTALAHGESILYPDTSKRVDYEAELAFIIKREAYKAKKEEAGKYILGYTCLNDVTARDLQKKDGQWTRAKSFNTFAPFGPYIYIPENDFNPNKLNISAKLNGEIKQKSNTDNLIFNVEYLVEFVSNIMTLKPGDVISTGTPSGIGPMQKEDIIEIEVEKVGKLVNKVE